jgi:hypothetical protein
VGVEARLVSRSLVNCLFYWFEEWRGRSSRVLQGVQGVQLIKSALLPNFEAGASPAAEGLPSQKTQGLAEAAN